MHIVLCHVSLLCIIIDLGGSIQANISTSHLCELSVNAVDVAKICFVYCF